MRVEDVWVGMPVRLLRFGSSPGWAVRDLHHVGIVKDITYPHLGCDETYIITIFRNVEQRGTTERHMLASELEAVEI